MGSTDTLFVYSFHLFDFLILPVSSVWEKKGESNRTIEFAYCKREWVKEILLHFFLVDEMGDSKRGRERERVRQTETEIKSYRDIQIE